MKTTRNKADTELVRQQNRSLVLEALRIHGPLASIELGEKTKLSPATISAITNDMLYERLIEEDKEETAKTRNAQRGRPKVKLRLAATAAIILGIRITHNQISLLLGDFCGQIKTRQSIALETVNLGADVFSKMLVKITLDFLEKNDVKPLHVSIISVAVQGSIDASKGEIIWSPAFSARHIAISKPLTDAIGAKCLVSNDTNTIAHLLHVENMDERSSFAVLYLGSGIGLGLFINGKLLEGTEGSASEFGHMLWRFEGALCRCGRKGCIEAYASDFGIYRNAHPELAKNNPATITPDQEAMKEFADRARKDDRNALKAFQDAGSAIGDGLVNLIMLINPKHIYFTGPGINHYDLLEESLKQSLVHTDHDDKKTKLSLLKDERDLIETGLMALAYTCLDREVFAKRVSVADVAARHGRLSFS